MEIKFESTDLTSDEIEVIIKSRSHSVRVEKLLNYLQKFEKKQSDNNIPIKADDRVLIIKATELMMVEVNQNELSFFTETQLIKSAGKLKDIRLRLNLPNFIQVSRFAIINMNYLQSIESGFSGTLVAKLKGNVKTTVSRRYVPVIKQYLGL